jgi:hypothetical protein
MRKLPTLIAGLITASTLTAAPARASNEPAYIVVAELSATAEVRDYAPMQVAEVRVETEDFDRAGSLGFEPLAAYIFGANARSERIGMTSPVTQRGSPTGWVVGFVMPERYTPESLPRPTDPDIRIIQVPRRNVAAIRFSGRWTPIRHAEHWRLLQRELDKAGWVTVGEPKAAQYNAPWLPGPLRRNEVLVPVRRRD